MKKSLSLLLLLSVAVTAPLHARGKKKAAPTEPGTYKSWGPDIDQLEIVRSFKLADYDRIEVEAFDTSKVELPDKDDNSYNSAKHALAAATEDFTTSLGEQELAQKVSIAEDRGSKAAGTLLVRAKVTLMDPGSRAARYWAGFGAGAARSAIEGEIVDAKSGETLLRFVQERRSGVGAFGGGYKELMTRNLRTIGEDVANILKQF